MYEMKKKIDHNEHNEHNETKIKNLQDFRS